MTPELEKHGFRKLRRKYRRHFEDRLESFSIEAHTFSHSQRASFEVGASIYIPEVARALGREAKELDRVGGYECGVHHNVRQIMPKGNRFLGVVTSDDAENRVQADWFIEGLNGGVLP